MILINPLSHTYKCIPDDKQFNLIQQKIQTLSRNYIFSKKERKKKTRKIISFFMVMFVYKIYVYTIDRTHQKEKKSKESSCSRSQRKLNTKENIFRFLHCLKLRNNNNNNCVMIFQNDVKDCHEHQSFTKCTARSIPYEKTTVRKVNIQTTYSLGL